jgi:hypothetical protein
MPRTQKQSARLERQTRRAYLLAQLKVQVDSLCESHKRRSAKRIDQTLHRVLRTVIELKAGRLLAQDKEAFVEHLVSCAYTGEPYVELGTEVGEGNLVHISGVFDLVDLSKRFVWSEVAPGNIKVVGEDHGS